MELVITLISSIVTLIIALTALIKVIKQSNKIQELHLMVNSRLTQLLTLTGKSSFAEGVKSETDKKTETDKK
jgi:predicted Holliday junction resolvase-like endonuclease